MFFTLFYLYKDARAIARKNGCFKTTRKIGQWVQPATPAFATFGSNPISVFSRVQLNFDLPIMVQAIGLYDFVKTHQ